MKSRPQSRVEEIVNSISHGAGVLVAIACLVLLLVFAGKNGNVWQIVSFSIFGSSMIMLYLASTLYHGVLNIRLKLRLNRWDHSMIYILIAGTYTPVCLSILQGTFGWIIFGLIWAMAVSGVIYKLFFYRGGKIERRISAFLYIAMGWVIIIAIVPLLKHALPLSLWFLLAGGLSYSLGVIFYLWTKLKFSHGIFHLFIMAGSVCHFFAFLVTVV
ncbi:MAG TPA: hemolysin III family protein [Bacteroidales bacterium]|nr:hemolysin III family protein [Bacteroidales bacterium]HQL70147.1 hemolysin III family protein [Bacteroidales bacterium]